MMFSTKQNTFLGRVNARAQDTNPRQSDSQNTQADSPVSAWGEASENIVPMDHDGSDAVKCAKSYVLPDPQAILRSPTQRRSPEPSSKTSVKTGSPPTSEPNVQTIGQRITKSVECRHEPPNDSAPELINRFKHHRLLKSKTKVLPTMRRLFGLRSLGMLMLLTLSSVHAAAGEEDEVMLTSSGHVMSPKGRIKRREQLRAMERSLKEACKNPFLKLWLHGNDAKESNGVQTLVRLDSTRSFFQEIEEKGGDGYCSGSCDAAELCEESNCKHYKNCCHAQCKTDDTLHRNHCKQCNLHWEYDAETLDDIAEDMIDVHGEALWGALNQVYKDIKEKFEGAKECEDKMAAVKDGMNKIIQPKWVCELTDNMLTEESERLQQEMKDQAQKSEIQRRKEEKAKGMLSRIFVNPFKRAGRKLLNISFDYIMKKVKETASEEGGMTMHAINDAQNGLEKILEVKSQLASCISGASSLDGLWEKSDLTLGNTICDFKAPTPTALVKNLMIGRDAIVRLCNSTILPSEDNPCARGYKHDVKNTKRKPVSIDNYKGDAALTVIKKGGNLVVETADIANKECLAGWGCVVICSLRKRDQHQYFRKEDFVSSIGDLNNKQLNAMDIADVNELLREETVVTVMRCKVTIEARCNKKCGEGMWITGEDAEEKFAAFVNTEKIQIVKKCVTDGLPPVFTDIYERVTDKKIEDMVALKWLETDTDIKEILETYANDATSNDSDIKGNAYGKARDALAFKVQNGLLVKVKSKLDEINIPFADIYKVAPWLNPHAKVIWEAFKTKVTKKDSDLTYPYIIAEVGGRLKQLKKSAEKTKTIITEVIEDFTACVGADNETASAVRDVTILAYQWKKAKRDKKNIKKAKVLVKLADMLLPKLAERLTDLLETQDNAKAFKELLINVERNFYTKVENAGDVVADPIGSVVEALERAITQFVENKGKVVRDTLMQYATENGVMNLDNLFKARKQNGTGRPVNHSNPVSARNSAEGNTQYPAFGRRRLRRRLALAEKRGAAGLDRKSE